MKKFLINVPGLSLLLFAGLLAEAAAVETARAAVGFAAARAAAVALDPSIRMAKRDEKRKRKHIEINKVLAGFRSSGTARHPPAGELT